MTSDESRLVADTHALIWHLTQSDRLSETARGLMRSVDRGESELVVPVIVLAEALSVSERKNPGVTFEQVLMYIENMPRVVVADVISWFSGKRGCFRGPWSCTTGSSPRPRDSTARPLISRDRQLGGIIETVW